MQPVVILTLFLLVVSHSPALALIPKQCAQNITGMGGSGVCCPIPKGSRLPCGGPRRGTCQPVYPVQEDPLNPTLRIDDRMAWPARYYNKMCRCEGNFFGLACDECWYNWKGKNCDEQDIHVRRNVLSLSAEERRMFINVVAEMPKTKTNNLIFFENDTHHLDPMRHPILLPVNLQYMIIYIHEYTSRGTLFDSPQECMVNSHLDNNHNVVGFLTWHRYLMLTWERELRKIAVEKYNWHDFALPYWDWIDADKCDPCTNDLIGAGGPWKDGLHLLHPNSPFANFTEYCSLPSAPARCIGCHTTWPKQKPVNREFISTKFPSTEDLEFTLSRNKQVSNGYLCQFSRHSVESVIFSFDYA